LSYICKPIVSIDKLVIRNCSAIKNLLSAKLSPVGCMYLVTKVKYLIPYIISLPLVYNRLNILSNHLEVSSSDNKFNFDDNTIPIRFPSIYQLPHWRNTISTRWNCNSPVSFFLLGVPRIPRCACLCQKIAKTIVDFIIKSAKTRKHWWTPQQ